eukprot:Hpha_TRINITY_DN34422_c0_g1::TRINITY_DN34422_c0_g1_i1::g.96139::m.96139
MGYYNLTSPWSNREHLTKYLLLSLSAYLVAERAESSFRFGWYQFASDVMPTVCDCPDPPCASGALNGLSSLAVFIIVLFVDFHLTRGFASALKSKLQREKSSAEVATEIASALSRYNVDDAEKAIRSGVDLPEELAEAYRRLLSNLRLYRDYLPDALLSSTEGGDEG